MNNPSFNRRDALRALAGIAAAASTPSWAQTGSWPQRPIKIVVPVAAGGIIDLLARAVSEVLTPVLKVPLVVDSKPGADHLIGIQSVARSDPDGYTWLCASIPFTVNPSLRRESGYDPLKDFRPLSLIATSPNLLMVSSSVPAKTVSEFVALAKSKPGTLTYGNPGNGSSNHLGMELFKSEAGLDILGVPYKGQPPAIPDLLAGRLDAMMMSSSLATNYITAGTLRPLAIVASERSAAFPNVPTMKQSGYPNADVVPWFGLLVPAKTPDAIVQRVSADLNAALKSTALRTRIDRIGATPYPPHSPAEFDKLIRAELAKWPAVLGRAGIEKA
jgi:tripartite-type tricarboxylate transporter receptor subunit TctC